MLQAILQTANPVRQVAGFMHFANWPTIQVYRPRYNFANYLTVKTPFLCVLAGQAHHCIVDCAVPTKLIGTRIQFFYRDVTSKSRT